VDSFGQELKKLRGERRMSIRELGEASGVSHCYLSQLENGEREAPKPKLVRKLANGLKMPYVRLMLLAGHLKEEDFTDIKLGVKI
jgi:transcriptional regulator with XRE-family HTH domain